MKFILAAIILAQLATASCTQQKIQLEEREELSTIVGVDPFKAVVDSLAKPKKELSNELRNELSPRFLGCWKDVTTNRAITGGIRSYGTVQECWNFAKEHNYPVFAVENGGECFAAPDAQFTYKKHGRATGKCDNWTGGSYAMDVYKTNKDFAFPEASTMQYASLGCWTDRKDRAIVGGIRLKGTVVDCWKFAKDRGFSVFAVQNKIECFTAHNATDTYQRFGSSKKCEFGGGTRGGYWAMNVYRVQPDYLGCYEDEPERAIAGGIRLRDPSVKACEDYARNKNFSVFALENNGECFTAHDAQETYLKYGHSDACFMAEYGYGKGRGGAWGMDVYKINY